MNETVVNVLLDQLVVLRAGREELERVQRLAEEEFVGAVADAYANGCLSDADLADLYARVRGVSLQGFGKVWNARVPRKAGWFAMAARTNSLVDRWSGERGDVSDVPGGGCWVVYALSDAGGVVVRVGATNALRMMLRKREGDTPGWVRWDAGKAQDGPSARRGARVARKEVLGQRWDGRR